MRADFSSVLALAGVLLIWVVVIAALVAGVYFLIRLLRKKSSPGSGAKRTDRRRG